MPSRWPRVFWTLPTATTVALALLVGSLEAAPPLKADIAPSALTLGNATLSSGGTTGLKLTVSNLGGSTARSVAVTVSVATAATTSRVASFDLGTLSPGASGTVSTTLTAPTQSGTYTVIAAATMKGSEASTANNRTSTTLTVASSSTTTTNTTTSTRSGSTSSSSSTTTSSGSSTASCNKYQSFFDTVSAANKSSLDGQAVSGTGATYYNFSYILGGTLAMFEGTHDVKYLEQMLTWAETMMASAKVLDYQGKKNWAGTWSSTWAGVPIAYMLEDFQGSAELARLARVILTDPGLTSAYGSRAQATYRFVKDHVVDKWLYARKAQSWFQNVSDDPSRFYNDKTTFLIRMLLDLHLIDGNPAYSSLAGDLLDAFIQRLEPYTSSSLVWDLGVSGPAYDTSHANRMPYMAVDAYTAGIKINKTHLSGLSNLLTRVIWDQSLTSPRFTNYIDGDNSDAFGRPAWGNGQVYSGWVTLGAHDPSVQKVAEAVLAAIIAGVRNLSLDYMSTVYGKIALAGYVTRNMRVANTCS